MRQDARHLHAVQLGDEGQNLGDELVFHQFANFFLAVSFPAGKQVGDTDFERPRKPLQESKSSTIFREKMTPVR